MKRIVVSQLAAIMLLMVSGGNFAWSQGPGHSEERRYQAEEERHREADIVYKNYFRTDSAYVYRWDLTASDWQLYQVQYYSYSEGRLTELLTRNYSTGANVSLSVYTYDSSGRTEASTNYSWAGEWIYSTRYMNEYDSQGRIISLRLQKWINGAWAEERLQQNYIYDAFDRAIGYETIYWRNNTWTLPTVSELSYNALGQLEYNLATRPGGAIDYRIIYEYNEKGIMTQFYTQYPAGDGWSNWNLRSFQYDPCGGRQSQIQYTGEGPDWIPSTKNVFFTSFNFELYAGKKLPICHKGKTIRVSVEAIPAHLRHGDCIGECIYEKDHSCDNVRFTPFTIYPNPAREKITVEIAPDCNCNNARIELMDYSGKMFKSVIVGDNSSITINRGNLRSGHYFVRLVGKEVYSQSVIFE
jgi:hypothetical protein